MQQTLRKISFFFNFIEPYNVYCNLCNSNFVLHKTNNPSRAIRHTKSLMHKKNEKKIFNHNQESTHIENDIFLSKENENLKQIDQNYDIEINQDKDFFQRISTSSLSSDSMMRDSIYKLVLPHGRTSLYILSIVVSFRNRPARVS